MPRRSRPTGADAMPRCPTCNGVGVVIDPTGNQPTRVCGTCGGLGRVSLNAVRNNQGRQGE